MATKRKEPESQRISWFLYSFELPLLCMSAVWRWRYSVFDESGKVIYSNATFTPYLVRVSIEDLNIRKGPGTDYDKTGKYTGKGAFTIVEEAEGKGASLWGLLKSYQKKRNGWISLDYAERV